MRRTTRLVRLDVGRLARQLHDGGLDVDATWVRCGPRGTSERPRPGVPAPRTGRPYPAVVAGRLARHVCGLLSAGADTARPDVPTFTRPSWVAAGRAALVSHGDDGQPDRVTIHVRPPRPATVTFDELTGRLPGLSDALPSGWRARLSLATGFIATGEHGPHVTVWAAPDDHRRAPVVLADRTDHGLRRVLETVDDDLALLGDPVGWVAATVG